MERYWKDSGEVEVLGSGGGADLTFWMRVWITWSGKALRWRIWETDFMFFSWKEGSDSERALWIRFWATLSF